MEGVLPDQKRNKILDRVKKLLALSTSSNVNEAANAAAAAQKLMLEHRLTEADVSDTQEGQMFELSMGAAGFDSRWKFVLVTAVARAFFCEAVGLRVGKRRKVRIVGRKEDVGIAAQVFRYLHSEIDRLAKIEIESIDWDDGVLSLGGGTFWGSLWGSTVWGIEHDPEQYLESFRRGAVAAVVAKFRTGEEAFVASDTRVLTIAKSDRDQVHAYVGARFTDTRKPGLDDVVEVDDLAFVRGYEQAQAISLPGHGRASEDVRDPEKSGVREAGRAPAGEPGSGSVAEVFVKSEVKPTVDVVVTHAGSVPVAPASQPDSPGGDAEPGGPESLGREEVRNVESFFARLKKWWEMKD
jgi:Protein of unknown function (DUF2786)